MSTWLGSVMEPEEKLVIDGHKNVFFNSFDPFTADRMKVAKLAALFPQPISTVVKEDAYRFLAKARKLGRRGKMIVLLSLLLSCRVHGTQYDLDELVGLGLTKDSRRPGKIAYKVLKLGVDIDVSIPMIDHRRAILRMVDELGIDRKIILLAESKYERARFFRAGNPKATMGAIIYGLAKERYGKNITQYMVATRLGLSEFTIRETWIKVRNLVLFE